MQVFSFFFKKKEEYSHSVFHKSVITVAKSTGLQSVKYTIITQVRPSHHAIVALLWLLSTAKLLSWVMAFNRLAQQLTPGTHVMSMAY